MKPYSGTKFIIGSSMIFKGLTPILLVLYFFTVTNLHVQAQSSTFWRIGGLKQVEMSPLHTYFSKADGSVVVYRNAQDGLIFLFENGEIGFKSTFIGSDTRFAYAYDQSDQLFSILDPNSLLLYYSRFQLSFNPKWVWRDQQKLWVLNEQQLASVDISNPLSVDTTMQLSPVAEFLGDSLEISFLQGPELITTTDDGSVYHKQLAELADSTAKWKQLGKIAEESLLSVSDSLLYSWDASNLQVVVRQFDQPLNRIDIPFSISKLFHDPNLARTYAIVDGNRLFEFRDLEPLAPKQLIKGGSKLDLVKNSGIAYIQIGEKFERFYPSSFLSESTQAASVAFSKPKFSYQARITHPYSEPLLVEIPLESGWLTEDLDILMESSTGAQVIGRNLIWTPTMQDVGIYPVKLYAFSRQGLEDSLSFEIEIRSFNAPPRFLPFRTQSIVVGEDVEVRVQALDPDGQDRLLIRYIARELPDGAAIEEATGIIRWKPSYEQVGMHQLEIIASDQYGASSSQRIQLKVIELKKGEE